MFASLIALAVSDVVVVSLPLLQLYIIKPAISIKDNLKNCFFIIECFWRLKNMFTRINYCAIRVSSQKFFITGWRWEIITTIGTVIINHC
jgi:hypothetical protein